MRQSSWKHAKHRRNDVVKTRRRYKLEKDLGLIEPGTKFDLSFSKHSIACKCGMCSLDRELGKRDRLRRANAVLDIRERDYELEQLAG